MKTTKYTLFQLLMADKVMNMLFIYPILLALCSYKKKKKRMREIQNLKLLMWGK